MSLQGSTFLVEASLAKTLPFSVAGGDTSLSLPGVEDFAVIGTRRVVSDPAASSSFNSHIRVGTTDPFLGLLGDRRALRGSGPPFHLVGTHPWSFARAASEGPETRTMVSHQPLSMST